MTLCASARLMCDRDGAELCAPDYVAKRIEQRDFWAAVLVESEDSGLSAVVVNENEFLRGYSSSRLLRPLSTCDLR